MKISKKFKKIIFFYLIFNITAYAIFLLGFSPKIENEEKESDFNEINKSKYDTYTQNLNYILIPNYKVVEECSNCKLKESDNFYPFHKFTFAFGSGDWNGYTNSFVQNNTKGFVGIFGFYGHLEFIFYVILPILIFLLFLLYKKFINT